MPNLYTIQTKKGVSEDFLEEGEKFSVIYHNLFDYPMDIGDMIRWRASPESILEIGPTISNKNGYFFIEGKEAIVYKKVLRKRISVKKMQIAKKAAQILSFIPSIQMVAVTGSLAMENSDDASDIDLMIVTKKGILWLTRLFTYCLIHLLSIKTRRPGEVNQKDKLCLNIWLDESDFSWKERNLYTAHEIAQIVPLVNKNETYEKFLYKNNWIKNFWPNASKIIKPSSITNVSNNILVNFIERVAFKIQRAHMNSKITNETITCTRALFHPQDWGKIVLGRLNSSHAS